MVSKIVFLQNFSVEKNLSKTYNLSNDSYFIIGLRKIFIIGIFFFASSVLYSTICTSIYYENFFPLKKSFFRHKSYVMNKIYAKLQLRGPLVSLMTENIKRKSFRITIRLSVTSYTAFAKAFIQIFIVQQNLIKLSILWLIILCPLFLMIKHFTIYSNN